MKVQTTQAQVWWVALFDEIRPVRSAAPGAFMEAIQKAFSFRIVPTVFKVGEGVEYHHGSFLGTDGLITIDKLTTYNDGVNIAVQSNTEDADRVLEKTLEIAFSIGVREPITPPAHSYVSNVVADLNCSIDNFFPAALFDEVGAIAPKNGRSHIFSLGFQFDPLLIERRPLAPGNPGFRIERREGFPYEANRYFSIANMATSKHLSVLEHLESAARKSEG